MTVYSCVQEWEAMLTCIYVAWSSKLGHENIKLEIEPIGQYDLFSEYIHIDADSDKARSVTEAVIRKISPRVYHELAYCSMAYEKDVLDNIYRVMLLGFAYGAGVLEMLQYRDVMRNAQIRKRIASEVCRFTEFTRFHEVGPNRLLVAHIEPKSKILYALEGQFCDRMPSENWMIVDDVHRMALIHPKDEQPYYRMLSEQELANSLKTEDENDAYTDLWKVFFDTIAIEQRRNEKCQLSHYPKWTRKHAVEWL